MYRLAADLKLLMESFDRSDSPDCAAIKNSLIWTAVYGCFFHELDLARISAPECTPDRFHLKRPTITLIDEFRIRVVNGESNFYVENHSVRHLCLLSGLFLEKWFTSA